jgi:hypothetical protein
VASAVDICNIALSHIGADAVVISIAPPDGSAESGHCARFYPIARRSMIEAHAWSWAKTRVTLAEVENDSLVWSFAYAKPADCIRPLRVLTASTINAVLIEAVSDGIFWPQSALLDELFTERGSADFDVEGSVIRCHQPEAVLLYLRDVTDTTKWGPNVTTALGMLLAGYVAGPIIKGVEGARIGQSWRQAALLEVAKAAAADGNGSSERSEFTPNHIRARL